MSEGNRRKSFERRWYNNNFFDDGYHYRYVSRVTGRVVDLTAQQDSFIPYRAIPKASRQVRGVANLILANQPQPVIYPERIVQSKFSDLQSYQQAMQGAKDTAQKVGWWIEDQWRDKNFNELLTSMVLLTSRHGVSYMQLWPNTEEETIELYVCDAFEIYLYGQLTSIYDSPMIVKVYPHEVDELKEDEYYDEEQRGKLTADNKYASSEIKEAYMRTRFGQGVQKNSYPTILLKEAFIKERINDDNKSKVASDLGDAYKGKDTGDTIIRQVCEAAGVWLKDTYLDLPEYPFVDYRMEPGPIYQVPLIERFIPANKTLDAVMSRIERHIGTMAVGVWLKRRGENYRINNIAGGQEVEYDTAPPAQMQTTQLGAYVFNFIEQLNSIIEEQGASTAALGNIPQGVKSGVAIESLKATEYANLKIPTDQLKTTVKKIAERMIDYAATTIISPQTVYRMEDGNPNYFDVIGQKGMETYQKISKKNREPLPDATLIKKEYKVDIEIQSGLGFTAEGKRDNMIKILDYIRGLAVEGYITKDAVSLIVKRFLEIFQFGTVSEFMEAMDSGDMPITEQQIQKMKVAMLEMTSDVMSARTSAKGPVPPTGDPDMMKIKEALASTVVDTQGGGQPQGGMM